MLPFYGLCLHNIQDPTFETGEIGDFFVATRFAHLYCVATNMISDGVCDSFLDRKLPAIPKDSCVSVDKVTYFLINQTFESHTANRTDPDDVSLGAIGISNVNAQQTYPYTAGTFK